jgi:hypothetical protein
MPVYRIEALEKFVVRTVYNEVHATSPQQAVAKCKQGIHAYDSHSIEDGYLSQEEWIETVRCEITELDPEQRAADDADADDDDNKSESDTKSDLANKSRTIFATKHDDAGLLYVHPYPFTEPPIMLDYLVDFENMGIHDATYGQVNCTPEQAATHNNLLDKMIVDGLANCKIGEHGTFYHRLDKTMKKHQVTTFLGHVIAETGKNGFAVFVTGNTIRFQYTPNIIGKHVSPGDRMMFRGRLQVGQDLFNFKRIL